MGLKRLRLVRENVERKTEKRDYEKRKSLLLAFEQSDLIHIALSICPTITAVMDYYYYY